MATIDYTTETYHDGSDHEAIFVSNASIEAALGRPLDEPAEDLETITRLLVASGAPAWVADAAGVLEDGGHIWIGPAIEA